MIYRIARNGTQYGPYTEAEVRQYLGSGHILLTDLVQVEGSTEWALVGAVFASFIAQGYVSASAPPPAAPSPQAAAYPASGTVTALPSRFPDPPDFPWWLALVLGIVSFGFFFVVWDIVESSWLRRVRRGSSALTLYLAVAVLYLIRLPGSWATVRYNMGVGPTVYAHSPGLALAAVILLLVARFVFRRELLQHFNGPERLPVHLNAFWTLLLGGLYFQFKFNRINRYKRELGLSPAL